jgi:hypothetical protein
MKLQNRLFLSVMLMASAALGIGAVCLESSRGLFDNQAKVYNSGLAVFHLKKVSDAMGVDTIGAVQKVRNGAPWAWEDGAKIVADAEASADEHWKAYAAMDKTKDEKYQASIVGVLLDNNKHLMENLKNDFANKDARDLEIQATSVLYPSIDPILDNLRKLEDINEKIGQDAITAAQKGFTNSFNFMMAAITFLLLVALILGFWTASWALRPVGALARNWVGPVDQVSSLSVQVASAAGQLNGNLLNSAAQLQKTTGSMEQMVSWVQQNNQETVRTRNWMDETNSCLMAGGESAYKTVESYKNLGQSVEKIFQVVKTIEEIAFQTNILALNAGVEAVRAGEQGKEFVLVVEEIRNLSQRCSQVARETSKLITENVRQASEGQRLSEETAKVFAQSAEKAGRVTNLLKAMEEGVEIQGRGLQEIRTSLFNAEQEAYRNSILSEKAGAAGASLSQQVELLKGVSKQLFTLVSGVVKEPRQDAQPGHFKVARTNPLAAVSPAPVAEVPPPTDGSRIEKTGTDGGGKVIRMNK